MGAELLHQESAECEQHVGDLQAFTEQRQVGAYLRTLGGDHRHHGHCRCGAKGHRNNQVGCVRDHLVGDRGDLRGMDGVAKITQSTTSHTREKIGDGRRPQAGP